MHQYAADIELLTDSNNYNLRKNSELILSYNYYIRPLYPQKGALAQLARALDWQSKGQGFDSPMLHNTSL